MLYMKLARDIREYNSSYLLKYFLFKNILIFLKLFLKHKNKIFFNPPQ